MNDQYVQTLKIVFDFLRKEGFQLAEQSLREEVTLKDLTLDILDLANPNGESSATLGSIENANNEVDGANESQDDSDENSQIPASSEPKLRTLDSYPLPDEPSRAHVSLREHLKYFRQRKLPWPTDLDEYDNMDDVGYIRHDITNREEFVENELDLASEDGSEAYCMHAGVELIQGESDDSLCDGDSSFQNDNKSSFDDPILSSTELSGQVCFETLSQTKDEIWDMGPSDIKLVDPVTTPDRKLTRQGSKESKPVLSRVESLSSSFKDFDIERCEEDGVHSKSPDETAAGAGPLDSSEVIDFAVITGSSSELPLAVDAAGLWRHSRTSSMDVVPDASLSEVSEQDIVLFPKASHHQAMSSESEPKENGGFSFPVTPPADVRIFTSWPSAVERSSVSSLTEHMHPGYDDELAAAEYADEGYRSKPDSPMPERASVSVPLPSDIEEAEELEELFRSKPREPSLDLNRSDQGVKDGAEGKEKLPVNVESAGDEGDHLEALAELEVAPLDESLKDEGEDASPVSWAPLLEAAANADGPMPRYTLDEEGRIMYDFDPEFINNKYEIFEMRIIHRRNRTGFEETKDFPIRLNDLIAGRYQVMDFLGSAAFSRAVQALDVRTGNLVCLKIIKNNKDYFDQSLDEIKLLKYVNSLDPNDEFGIVRLFDFFYYKEHLFLVCELLRANLYEFQKYNKESGEEPYFTNARIQKIARQVLRSLAYLHNLNLIHSDLKPENILIKSYSKCQVKVIDLGSSCFITDQLSSYVQSRSYRAPEVILGMPYDQKIDIWSLGCILAELSSGYVLFQNDSLATLLARLEGILGPIPDHMVRKSRYGSRFFTRSRRLYERSSVGNENYELLLPKRTSLKHRVPNADEGLLDFISFLLAVDPRHRPTAVEALRHPWLEYPHRTDDPTPPEF